MNFGTSQKALEAPTGNMYGREIQKFKTHDNYQAAKQRREAPKNALGYYGQGKSSGMQGNFLNEQMRG